MENEKKLTTEEMAANTDPAANAEATNAAEQKPEISMDLKDMISSICSWPSTTRSSVLIYLAPPSLAAPDAIYLLTI